jgi:sortase A
VSFSTIRVTAGRVILVAGVLVLLFMPYLLWGTGLITARAQSDLRQQFAAVEHTHHDQHALPAPHPGPAAPVVAPNIPAPALGGPVGILSIPKIALSMVVVEGTDADQLRSGPGHYPGTPLPGEAGNVAIAGHRTTYLHPFYNLNELAPGDAINILTVQGLFVYHVISSQAVAPTDVAVVAPTPTPMLTLTTCNPRYSASQRLVVHAALVADVLTGTTAPAPTPSHAPSNHQSNHPSTTTVADSPIHNDWWAAIGWGLAVVALVIGLWVLATRLEGGRRLVVVVGGTVVWLGVVYLFFGALAPLLPASF